MQSVGLAIQGAIDLFATADKAIVIDALLDSLPPGQIAIRDAADLDGFSTSLTHHFGLDDVLALVKGLEGRTPEIKIVGVAPKEMNPWCDKLSPEVAAAIPRAVEAVLAILHDWGVETA